MPTATSAQLFQKLPQFVNETTEGTTPTASPTFTTCGSCTSLELRKNNEIVDIGQVGVEDVLDLAQGRYTFNATLRFQLLDSAFFKRFVNAANYVTPTGTISQTFSILYSQFINGATENFVFLKGCRPKRASFEVNISRPIESTIEVECMNIVKPATSHGLTTPSFAANPAGAVWTWLDGGAGPLSWNAIALNARSFTVNFERNTEPEFTIGTPTPFGTMPHARRISGTLTNLLTNTEATTLETDYDANTPRTLAYVLKTAVSTLTLSGAEIETYNRSHTADDNTGLVETCGFKAVSASLT